MKQYYRIICPFISCLCLGLYITTPYANAALSLLPSAPSIAHQDYILLDAHSGEILAQQNAEQKASPASLTKMMTAYVIFHALKNQQIHLTDAVIISKKAWKMRGSRMFIEPRNKVSVDQLLQGIIVSSGNDASVAMSEYIAGSEQAFTEMMNQSAQYLGMKDSHFTDSTGLPHPNHYSTPHDLAILARALIQDYPEYYHYFKQKKFTYNNITQSNRNTLLWRNQSVDGLKTGHTESAGYCLVSSAQQDKTRLIAVVLGSQSVQQRAKTSRTLLTWGFRFFDTVKLYTPDSSVVKERVWGGQQKTVSLGVEQPIYLTVPKGKGRFLKTRIQRINSALFAPIKKGDVYAHVHITLQGKPLQTIPLVALNDDPKGSLWTRFSDSIARQVHQWLN